MILYIIQKIIQFLTTFIFLGKGCPFGPIKELFNVIKKNKNIRTEILQYLHITILEDILKVFFCLYNVSCILIHNSVIDI